MCKATMYILIIFLLILLTKQEELECQSRQQAVSRTQNLKSSNILLLCAVSLQGVRDHGSAHVFCSTKQCLSFCYLSRSLFRQPSTKARYVVNLILSPCKSYTCVINTRMVARENKQNKYRRWGETKRKL